MAMIIHKVSKTTNMLVFFNQYRQFCVYDKMNTTTGKYIPLTFALLRQQSGAVQRRWVSVRMDNSDLFLQCRDEAPNPDEYAFDEYNFADDAGLIWYDDQAEPAIVIGMGDIRDGITNPGVLVWYPIPHVTNHPDSDIIIECVGPHRIRIHHKNVTSQQESVSFHNGCVAVS